MGLTTEEPSDSWQKRGIFLSSKSSRLSLGPIQPPLQWLPVALGVK